jgi:hypothetical protein
MKNFILILLLIFPLSLLSAKSTTIKLRHTEGFKSIKAGSSLGLLSDVNTNILLLGYNHYLNKNMFVGLDFNYEWGTLEQLKVKNTNLNAYFNYSLFTINQVLFFNAVGGVFAGVENTKSTIIDDTNSKSFVEGFLFGLSAEIFLSNTICLEPFYTQYWQANSELGNQFYHTGLSLKINF